jgi:hypothetical protein
MRIFTSESNLSKAILFTEARPTSLFVLNVNAASLEDISTFERF